MKNLRKTPTSQISILSKEQITNLDSDNIKKTLSERFVVPPFSVFDTMQGYWQRRKKDWLSLGIQSELGRGEWGIDPSGRGTSDNSDKAYTDNVGQDIMKGENKSFSKGYKYAETRNKGLDEKTKKALGVYASAAGSSVVDRESGITGTSIFDPVLCEIMYRWFCPQTGKILDPFAGGSVRGIVAEYLGYNYTGIELRKEQVIANYEQYFNIIPLFDNSYQPHEVWIEGDSKYSKELALNKYDMLLSCPPYYDLEVYSNLKGELSAIPSYSDFIEEYRYIISECVSMLKDNRFACFVVSEIRDKEGFYRGFVKDTINAFHDVGLKLYNEAILINSRGSLPIRVSNQFPIYRKLGRTHQNVIVFYKGNIKAIKEIFKE